MVDTTARKMFVNLAVRDLAKSKDFFSALGFSFNPKFTDDKAASMIVNDEAFVMLLTQPFFRTFTRRDICDTSRYTDPAVGLTPPTVTVPTAAQWLTIINRAGPRAGSSSDNAEGQARQRLIAALPSTSTL